MTEKGGGRWLSEDGGRSSVGSPSFRGTLAQLCYQCSWNGGCLCGLAESLCRRVSKLFVPQTRSRKRRQSVG
jgi:hypothetical protein